LVTTDYSTAQTAGHGAKVAGVHRFRVKVCRAREQHKLGVEDDITIRSSAILRREVWHVNSSISEYFAFQNTLGGGRDLRLS